VNFRSWRATSRRHCGGRGRRRGRRGGRQRPALAGRNDPFAIESPKAQRDRPLGHLDALGSRVAWGHDESRPAHFDLAIGQHEQEATAHLNMRDVECGDAVGECRLRDSAFATARHHGVVYVYEVGASATETTACL
jgi:hypothetical protein